MCCQKFVNCGAGTPHGGIFFDSNNQVVAPRQIADQVFIQRLHEAHIDQRCIE